MAKDTSLIDERFHTLLLTLPGYGWMAHHIPTLQELAYQCKTVTELGTYHTVSATVFAHILARSVSWDNWKCSLVCVDRDKSPEVDTLERDAGAAGVRFTFHQCDTREYPLEETDLLFVDSAHNYGQVWEEITRGEPYVRKYMVFHDTAGNTPDPETGLQGWGEIGGDGTQGVVLAIGYFLLRYPHWEVKYHTDKCCGLTVLQRKR